MVHNHSFGDDYDGQPCRCGKTSEQVQSERAERYAARAANREPLGSMREWGLERERLLRNDLRRERRQLYGR
jgi:hypothetical protein